MFIEEVGYSPLEGSPGSYEARVAGLVPDGRSFVCIDEIVKVVDDGASSHVFAAIGGEWQQVVTLEGVTGFDATTMHDNGMILV